MQIGIVGLPNVGKSSLFNSLCKNAKAESSNYPFCTIDPNVGVVEVPDARLDKLVSMYKPQKKIPAICEFVDIAGLVRGASKGEGLGNKFLANIRSCHAIAHVLRFFDDPNVIHVDNRVNPKEDLEVVESELIIKDLDTLDKSLAKAAGEAKSGGKEAKMKLEFFERIKSELEKGKKIIDLDLNEEEVSLLRDLHLLTSKPVLYIANVSEDGLKKFDANSAREQLGLDKSQEIVPICALLESQLAEINDEEAQELLKEFGIEKTGRDELIQSAYRKLSYETYFTCGPKEVRAWTIKKGMKAPQAAGVIHTDFEKGFICADVIHSSKLLEIGSEVKAKEMGQIKMQGKEYIMQDGDVCVFKFNN